MDFSARCEIVQWCKAQSLPVDQRGWQGQFGYNWNRWLAVGFDTSYFGGGSSLTDPKLNTATKVKLAPMLPLLPPGFNVRTGNTRTLTRSRGGPRLNYRGLKDVTLFIDARHVSERASTASNPILAAMVKSLLGPSM